MSSVAVTPSYGRITAYRYWNGCAPNQVPKGLKAFVGANPKLARLPLATQIGYYDRRVALEWQHLADTAAQAVAGWGEELGGDVEDEDYYAAAEERRDREIVRSLIPLGEGNNVQRMAWLIDATVAHGSGNYRGALDLAERAVSDADRTLDKHNSAKIGGYVVAARAAYKLGLLNEAKVYVDKGLKVAAAHPKRSRPLGTSRYDLLEIGADVAHAQASRIGTSKFDPEAASKQKYLQDEARLRNEARGQRKRLSMTIESPYINYFGFVPGGQLLAELQNASNEPVNSALPGHRSLALLISAVPSGASEETASVFAGSTKEILENTEVCLLTASTMSMRGDFVDAQKAMGSVIGAVNESNITRILETVNAVLMSEGYDKNEKDPNRAALQAFPDRFVEALEASGQTTGEVAKAGSPLDRTNPYPHLPSGYGEVITTEPVLRGMTSSLALFSNGGSARLARNIEKAVTINVAKKAIASALGRVDTSDDPEGKARVLATKATLQQFGPDLWSGIDYAKTAIVLLLRDPTAADVQKMQYGATWVRSKGLNTATQALNYYKARLHKDDDSHAEDINEIVKGLNSDLARQINIGAPLVFDVFGWQSAQVTNSTDATRGFERDIIRVAREYLTYRKADVRALEPHLRRLENGEGSALDRLIYDARPLLAAGFRALPEVSERLDVAFNDNLATGSSIPLPPVTNFYSAYFLTEHAARAGRWKDIVLMWQDSADWAQAYLPSLTVEDGQSLTAETDIGTGRYFNLALEALSRPLGLYLNALVAENRSQDVVKLADKVLPAIRGAESPLNTRNSEFERNVLAQFAPDNILAITGYALWRQGRASDAFLLAKMRVRKATLLDASGDVLIDRTLNPSLPSGSMSAYEQFLGIALTAQSGANWDDFLYVFDQSKASSAADAQILSATAAQAGPAAQEALQAFYEARNRVVTPSLLGDRFSNAAQLEIARRNLVQLLPKSFIGLGTGGTTIATLQKTLQPNEVAVSSMGYGEKEAFLVIRSKGNPEFYQSLTKRSDIRSLSADARTALTADVTGKATGKDLSPTVTALHAAATSQLLPKLRKGDHIIWSPGRDLQDAPVQLFKAPQDLVSPEGLRTRWLGAAYAITYATRLDALVQSRAVARTLLPKGGLAVGDIPFGQRKDGMLAKFPPTPLAARDIAQFVEQTSGRSLTGWSATVPNLRFQSKEALRFLMFHTHGTTKTAEGPALILSPASPFGFLRATEQDDGVFGAEDVMALKIRPRYVLLAACSTGAEASKSLEPFSGLVRSFLAIDAKAVLTSIGPVDEEAATEINRLTLTAMKQEPALMPAEALRRAQLKLSSGRGRLSAPAKWGQLVWVGDGGRP